MYKVKAIISFIDYLGKETDLRNEHIDRKKGDIFEVNKERFDYLNGNNEKKIKAVELIEIVMAKAEETKIEVKKENPKKKQSKIKK